jgi:hypothetical protein
MKPPFFIVSAVCENPDCGRDVFRREKRRITRIGESGIEYELSRLACPDCGLWAEISDIEAVTG